MTTADAAQVLGPIDFVLIEMPAGATTDQTGLALGDLLDRGPVSLYDIALVGKAEDATVRSIALDDPEEPAAAGRSAFAGAQSGLFDREDLDQAAEVLEAGTFGLLLAYENAWAVPFVAAAHHAGGQVVASERIPAQVLLDALDALDAVEQAGSTPTPRRRDNDARTPERCRPHCDDRRHGDRRQRSGTAPAGRAIRRARRPDRRAA